MSDSYMFDNIYELKKAANAINVTKANILKQAIKLGIEEPDKVREVYECVEQVWRVHDSRLQFAKESKQDTPISELEWEDVEVTLLKHVVCDWFILYDVCNCNIGKNAENAILVLSGKNLVGLPKCKVNRKPEHSYSRYPCENNNPTWGDFKKMVDNTEGVSDDMVINYMDFGYGFAPDADCGDGNLVVS